MVGFGGVLRTDLKKPPRVVCCTGADRLSGLRAHNVVHFIPDTRGLRPATAVPRSAGTYGIGAICVRPVRVPEEEVIDNGYVYIYTYTM